MHWCYFRKVWVCLITCMATRAVHLEVVLDLATQEFLLAFRQFIARRVHQVSSTATIRPAAQRPLSHRSFTPPPHCTASPVSGLRTKNQLEVHNPAVAMKRWILRAFSRSVQIRLQKVHHFSSKSAPNGCRGKRSHAKLPFHNTLQGRETFVYILRSIDFLTPQVEL